MFFFFFNAKIYFIMVKIYFMLFLVDFDMRQTIFA